MYCEHCTYLLYVNKSQLCYATEMWSLSLSAHKSKLERVERRATRWILQSNIGGMSYKERLLILDMLPLSYGIMNAFKFVYFVSHGRTRNCIITLLLCLMFCIVKLALSEPQTELFHSGIAHC